MDEFWLVVRDSKHMKASMRHKTREDAIEEAARLSMKENDRFYVMTVLGYTEPVKTPAVWVGVDGDVRRHPTGMFWDTGDEDK